MSWESSVEYYRIINQLVAEKLGGLHSAKSVMVSVDFDPIEELMSAGEWDQVSAHLEEAAIQAEAAGAEMLLIATNTMHKLFDRVSTAVSIPVYHIVDAAGHSIQQAGLKTVGLLGTRFTMEEDFYAARLEENFGLKVLVPDEADRLIVDRIIFKELVLGKVLPESKVEYLRIIGGLIDKGAEGIVLGCTEIPLLVGAADVPVPIFDTTFLHAELAVREALS
jgi:aspartate racemase